MNDTLARMLDSLGSLGSNELHEHAVVLGWILEKASFTGYSDSDYEGLLQPSLRFARFDDAELEAIVRKLEEVYLGNYCARVRSGVVWALGKYDRPSSRILLKRFLFQGVDDPEVGYQLAIALENVSEEMKTEVGAEQLDEMIERLSGLGRLEGRTSEVIERIIRRYV